MSAGSSMIAPLAMLTTRAPGGSARELGGADQVVGLGRVGTGDHERVDLAEGGVEVARPDQPGDAGRDLGPGPPVAPDVHPEPGQGRRDLPAEAAEPDEEDAATERTRVTAGSQARRDCSSRRRGTSL